MKVADISKELEQKENSVRTTLNRYKGIKFVSLKDGYWGNKANENGN